MIAAEEGRRRHGVVSPPLLLGLFYAALSVAWILGNPAGAAPDEPSHYLNALAVASGELKGEPVIAPLPASGDAKNDARKQAWLERTTRAVDVPPGLSPEGLDCNAFKSNLSAACQEGIQVSPGAHQGLHQLRSGSSHHLSGVWGPGSCRRQSGGRHQAGEAGGRSGLHRLVWMAIALLWERPPGPDRLLGCWQRRSRC